MTDNEIRKLIAEAQNGSSTAFEELIKKHMQKLNSFALSIAGGNRPLAEDILQDALINAFLYIKSFKGDSQFSSWLWRIVKNEFLKYQQRYKSHRSVSTDDLPEKITGTHDSPEKKVQEDERKMHLRRLMSELSSEDNEVLTLIEFQHMSYEEAADVIGISLNGLKSRVLRARKRLSEKIIENKKLFI